MAEPCNQHINEVLRLSREMMVLADLGDRDRTDPSCGVLYGNLRDAAWKLRREAERERDFHIQKGYWDIPDIETAGHSTRSAGE